MLGLLWEEILHFKLVGFDNKDSLTLRALTKSPNWPVGVVILKVK